MVRLGVVEANLKKLAKLRKEQLALGAVRHLVGLGYATLWNLIHSDGIDIKDKRDIARLIRNNKPVLEEWPTSSELEDKLGIPSFILNSWYRDENTRKITGAVKILQRIRFNPKWVGKTL